MEGGRGIRTLTYPLPSPTLSRTPPPTAIPDRSQQEGQPKVCESPKGVGCWVGFWGKERRGGVVEWRGGDV